MRGVDVGVGVGVNVGVGKLGHTPLCGAGSGNAQQLEGQRACMIRMRVPVNRLTIETSPPRSTCLWTLITSMGWVQRVATEHDVPPKNIWSASLDSPETAFGFDSKSFGISLALKDLLYEGCRFRRSL